MLTLGLKEGKYQSCCPKVVSVNTKDVHTSSLVQVPKSCVILP
jgi:hypothetical protein